MKVRTQPHPSCNVLFHPTYHNRFWLNTWALQLDWVQFYLLGRRSNHMTRSMVYIVFSVIWAFIIYFPAYKGYSSPTHSLYIICRICNKCICSTGTGLWMSYAQWHKSYNLFFFLVHLGIILIHVLGFYSGLSGRDRMAYLFSLCVVSLLSSKC
jgi:hypothetical protein